MVPSVRFKIFSRGFSLLELILVLGTVTCLMMAAFVIFPKMQAHVPHPPTTAQTFVQITPNAQIPASGMTNNQTNTLSQDIQHPLLNPPAPPHQAEQPVQNLGPGYHNDGKF